MASDKEAARKKWLELAQAARHKAAKLPDGRDREALLKEARQYETMADAENWASSPGLKPPTR